MYTNDSENQAPIKEAAELLTNKKYAEAEVATRALLGKRLSMWQRIYCTAMLADCLGSWYEAEEQRTTLDDLVAFPDGSVRPIRLHIWEQEPIEEYTEDSSGSLSPAASSSRLDEPEPEDSVEVYKIGSAEDSTTDGLRNPLSTRSISSPTTTSKTISPRGSFTSPTRRIPIATTQTLEERVRSLEQQMHNLQTTKSKEVMEEAKKIEKKHTASSINRDHEEALELSIAQCNFEAAQSKM
ncbi:hypothetical protein KCU65_g9604, partial [Aureobasidium melanogenum]